MLASLSWPWWWWGVKLAVVLAFSQATLAQDSRPLPGGSPAAGTKTDIPSSGPKLAATTSYADFLDKMLYPPLSPIDEGLLMVPKDSPLEKFIPAVLTAFYATVVVCVTSHMAALFGMTRLTPTLLMVAISVSYTILAYVERSHALPLIPMTVLAVGASTCITMPAARTPMGRAAAIMAVVLACLPIINRLTSSGGSPRP
jgi:uncharacterized membrane protein